MLPVIAEGLANVKLQGNTLIVCAGDPRGAEALEAVAKVDLQTPHLEFLMLPGSNGRGASIRAILEIADQLEADVLLFTADLVPESKLWAAAGLGRAHPGTDQERVRLRDHQHPEELLRGLPEQPAGGAAAGGFLRIQGAQRPQRRLRHRQRYRGGPRRRDQILGRGGHGLRDRPLADHQGDPLEQEDLRGRSRRQAGEHQPREIELRFQGPGQGHVRMYQAGRGLLADRQIHPQIP